METVVLAIIAMLAWFVTIYKFNTMRRNGWWRARSVTFYLWLFSLCTAIGLTLMVEPLYLAFDRLTGLPNLGWLVLYIAFALAIYCVSAGCYRMSQQRQPRIITWSLLVTLLVLFVVYVWGIVVIPEKPDHTVPETLAEIIFMLTLYVYIALLCAIPIVTYARLYRHEKLTPARLRWLVALAVTLLSTSVFFMKIMLTILTYQDPTAPAMELLYPLISGAVLIVGVLCPLCFLPNNLYITVARPFEFLGKALALAELKLLQNRLDVLWSPIMHDTLGPIPSLKSLDFRLYQCVITILDAKRTVAGYAEMTHGLAVSPAATTGKAEQKLLSWDEQKLKQARALHQELQKVDDHVEYSDLIRAYQQASRIIRWKMWAISLQGERLDDFAYQR